MNMTRDDVESMLKEVTVDKGGDRLDRLLIKAFRLDPLHTATPSTDDMDALFLLGLTEAHFFIEKGRKDGTWEKAEGGPCWNVAINFSGPSGRAGSLALAASKALVLWAYDNGKLKEDDFHNPLLCSERRSGLDRRAFQDAGALVGRRIGVAVLGGGRRCSEPGRRNKNRRRKGPTNTTKESSC